MTSTQEIMFMHATVKKNIEGLDVSRYLDTTLSKTDTNLVL